MYRRDYAEMGFSKSLARVPIGKDCSMTRFISGSGCVAEVHEGKQRRSSGKLSLPELLFPHRRLIILKAANPEGMEDQELRNYWRTEIRPHAGSPDGSDRHLASITDISVMRLLMQEAWQAYLKAASQSPPTS